MSIQRRSGAREGSYVIEVPDREVSVGAIDVVTMYRVALVDAGAHEDEAQCDTDMQPHDEPSPPVDVGDQRTVDIEDIGEQGDGIARVERGYVIIVPDTEQGERVIIEITDVRANLGFGEVVEREGYYE